MSFYEFIAENFNSIKTHIRLLHVFYHNPEFLSEQSASDLIQRSLVYAQTHGGMWTWNSATGCWESTLNEFNHSGPNLKKGIYYMAMYKLKIQIQDL